MEWLVVMIEMETARFGSLSPDKVDRVHQICSKIRSTIGQVSSAQVFSRDIPAGKGFKTSATANMLAGNLTEPKSRIIAHSHLTQAKFNPELFWQILQQQAQSQVFVVVAEKPVAEQFLRYLVAEEVIKSGLDLEELTGLDIGEAVVIEIYSGVTVKHQAGSSFSRTSTHGAARRGAGRLRSHNSGFRPRPR